MAVIVVFAWCTAPDDIDGPEAVVIETRAEDLHRGSREELAAADRAAEESKRIEIEREQARTSLADARGRAGTRAAERRRLEREYEEIRRKNVVVDDADLDDRERRLLARLRELQP
ncbi:MAG: hypothetical protein ACK4S4_15745 [Pyrinomonadaceae bacterium]